MGAPGQDVNVFVGNTFVVSQSNGDIDATPSSTHGLFHMDTRFLSRLVLTINGLRLNALSADDQQYHTCQFVLVPGTGTVYVDADMTVVRRRHVNPDYYGFSEDIEIINHTNTQAKLRLDIAVKADFADLFEVKDVLEKKGREYVSVAEGHLVLGYQREHFVRETWIRSSTAADLDDDGLHYKVILEPQGTWSTTIDIAAGKDGFMKPSEEQPRQVRATGADEWIKNAPKLSSSWRNLELVYEQAIVDLAALRFFSRLTPQRAMPAAGLPWFMAIFGRDSIMTSYQALPFLPELAHTTLKVLALMQGTVVDHFRDEEPGKIVHELRQGEMTAFEERPHSPYYGTADATPLFIVLLDEYERWTGDVEFLRSLERPARAALDWIDSYGDRDQDGYIEYERRNETSGLENQCWKDSWNSIIFSDGTLADLPRATCELQGYAYDAKRRGARIAREVWNDPEYATRLEQEAEALRERFNKDFWMDDKQFFALGLDGKKRKIDSLTSNVGHLLWSGIVDESKADAVVERLMSDALFNGWGVRTMSSLDRGYNPVGYHVGTVWPHDCSFIAWGLRRYGYKNEAARMAFAMFEAAPTFNMRLPEAMAGYPRKEMATPVPYPTACSPQAWASGTPLLMLRVMLGLDPVGERLVVDPAMPTEIERVELLGIPGRWGEADAFGRGRIDLAVH